MEAPVTDKVDEYSRDDSLTELYRIVAEFTYDIELFHDSIGKLLYVSPSFERVTGYKSIDYKNNLISENDFIFSDDLQEVNLILNDLQNQATVTHKEFRIICKDKSVKYLSICAQPVYNKDSKFIGFRSSIRDITNRKNSEQTNKESEEKYRTLFNNMVQGAFYQNSDNVLIDVNNSALEMFGLTKDEFLGRTSSDQQWRIINETGSKLGPQEHPSVKCLISGKPVKNEILGVFNKKNNTYYWLTVNAYPMFRPDEEKPFQVFVTMHDITEQKKSDEIIRQNEERLENLLLLTQMDDFSVQNIFDYALEVSIKLTKSKVGYIYYYSESDRRFTLYSWSVEAMKECRIVEKQTVYELDKTGIWGEAVRQRKPIIVNDFCAPNDFKKGYPEGHVELLRYMTIPVIVDNEIVGVFGVGNKIEEYSEIDVLQLTLLANSVWKIIRHKKAVEQIEKYSEELKQVNATKDKFFSIIAHDLRSPFSGLIGLTEIMADNHQNLSAEELKAFAKNINEASKQLFSLIENLLTWSSSQLGRIKFNPQRLNLTELINNNIELQKINANPKDITFKLNYTEDFEVYGDQNQLNTIFRNLFSNALKFSFPHSEINIMVFSNNPEFVEIDVIDNGIGMDARRIDSLFKLQSISGSVGTANEKGTGLGLILCKDFIEKNGGQIKIESEPEKGSSINFTIPLFQE